MTHRHDIIRAADEYAESSARNPCADACTDARARVVQAVGLLEAERAAAVASLVELRRAQTGPAFAPSTLARYCSMGCHNAPKQGGHGPWDGYTCKGDLMLVSAWVSRWTENGRLLGGAPDCPCRVTIKFDCQQAGDLGEEPGR